MPREQGETKTFRLPVTEDGTYRIHITAGLTPGSGSFEMRLDGEPIALRGRQEKIELFRPYRTLLRDFVLQDRELSGGPHNLTLEFLGAPAEVDKPEIGIDFIWIQKIEQMP
jgi:hypothetical protein